MKNADDEELNEGGIYNEKWRKEDIEDSNDQRNVMNMKMNEIWRK